MVSSGTYKKEPKVKTIRKMCDIVIIKYFMSSEYVMIKNANSIHYDIRSSKIVSYTNQYLINITNGWQLQRLYYVQTSKNSNFP